MSEGVLSAAERARMPKPHGRFAVWPVLRAADRSMTLREIWAAADHGQRGRDTHITTVEQYLLGLRRAGIVGEGDPVRLPGGRVAKTYRLIKDLGPEPPKVRRDGSLSDVKGDGRTRLWKVMRVLKDFDAVELSMTARVSEHTAAEYAKFLTFAGYLRIAEDHTHHPTAGKRRRWVFVEPKWTGPQAPVITKVKALFDPNIGEVVYARQTGRAA